MNTGDFYNITQAAEATGKTAPTIRKYYRAGKFPNAVERFNGKIKLVSIPHLDLVAAGLMDKVSSPPQPPIDPIRELIDQVQEYREALARAKIELEVTKERLQDYKSFVQLQQRQIETAAVQRKRRFWQRSQPTETPIFTPEQD
jgi:hypothetical protein